MSGLPARSWMAPLSTRLRPSVPSPLMPLTVTVMTEPLPLTESVGE